MVTKSSREMQKDREKIRPPFGGLKFCQGTHYLPLTFIPSFSCLTPSALYISREVENVARHKAEKNKR